MKNILRNRTVELAKILGIDELTNGDNIIKKVTELKAENRKLNNIIDNLRDENIYGVFLKLANSSSYYARNKELCDRAFSDVVKRDKFALMSADFPNDDKAITVDSMITERFAKMGLSYIHINDMGYKNIYFVGFNRSVAIENIIKLFEFTREQIEKKGCEIIVSFSREFSDISNTFEAYKDIQVCRDYRSIGDKKTILTADKIHYNPSLYIPVNFTEELKSLIMERNEKEIREYLNGVFDVNKKNGVPIIKLEHLLRIMQNTIMDALAMLQRNTSDMFDLEQVFIQRIEQPQAMFDIDAIVNNYINLLRFSLAGIPEKKKSGLNRSEVIKYINGHYSEDLYLEKLASQFLTTPKYFSNWFKREFSIGFSEYLADIRISHAKKILCDTGLPLSKVGEKCGYANPVTFAVAFKKHTGMPPGKFRELNLKD